MTITNNNMLDSYRQEIDMGCTRYSKPSAPRQSKKKCYPVEKQKSLHSHVWQKYVQLPKIRLATILEDSQTANENLNKLRNYTHIYNQLYNRFPNQTAMMFAKNIVRIFQRTPILVPKKYHRAVADEKYIDRIILPRSIKVTLNGSVYVLFNKKNLRDHNLINHAKSIHNNRKITFAKNIITGELCIRHSILAPNRHSLRLLKELKDITDKTQGLAKIIETYSTQFYQSKQKKWKLEIIQKYYPKGDLINYVHDAEITYNEIFNIFSGILIGLKELHSQKIIHRNFKPENVFITEDFQTRIANFNFSCFSSSFNEIKGLVCGTPGYRDPERTLILTNEKIRQDVRANGYSPDISEALSYKSDIWSAGMLFSKLIEEAITRSPISCFLNNFFSIQRKEMDYSEISHLLNIPLDDNKIYDSYYCCKLLIEKQWPEMPQDTRSLEYFIWKMCHIDPVQRFSAQETLDFLHGTIIPSYCPENNFFPTTSDSSNQTLTETTSHSIS